MVKNSTTVEAGNQQLYLRPIQRVFKFPTMALGARIRYYRKKLGWTLEQLSEASGVDVGTISALEKRNSKRSEKSIQIAQAFGLTVEQLQDEIDWIEVNRDSEKRRSRSTDRPRFEMDEGDPALVFMPRKHPNRYIANVIRMMEATDDVGRQIAQNHVALALKEYSASIKANPAGSTG